MRKTVSRRGVGRARRRARKRGILGPVDPFHFEPSLDALSLRSDVISSITILLRSSRVADTTARKAAHEHAGLSLNVRRVVECMSLVFSWWSA